MRPTLRTLISLLPLTGLLHAASLEELEPIPSALYHLWDRAIQDEDGWFEAPVRNRKKIGEHPPVTKKVRFREVEREIPVYEYSSKEVMVRSKGSSEAGQSKMEKKTIRVRGKQIGTKTEKKLVSDPNGPIVRTQTIRRAKYGPGGTDRWPLGRVGNNALQALMLQRSAIPEAQDAVDASISNLMELVEAYGLPDLTWDLVWMTMLFAESEDQGAQSIASEMVEKLMRAQRSQGPGAGMWGPIAVSPEYLAYLYQRFWNASELYAELEPQAETTNNQKLRKQFNDVTLELNDVKEELGKYTWYYESADPIKTSITLEDEWESKRSFNLPPEYPFHTMTTDLESTWLVLMAIRSAADHGVIQSKAPQRPQPGQLPPPPIPNPRQMMMRAATGIQRFQHTSGAFTEALTHAPSSAFSRIEGIRGIPLNRAVTYPELNSPITMASTAKGLASLSIIGDVLGPDVYRQTGRSMLKAKQLLDTRLETALSENAAFLGGHALGRLGLALALMDSGPEMEAAPKDLRSIGMSLALDARSEKSGTWGRSKPPTFLPAVWKAQAKVLPQRTKSHEDFNEPFVWRSNQDPKKSQNFSKFYSQQNTRIGQGAQTALALLVLSGGSPVDAEVPMPVPPETEAEGEEQPEAADENIVHQFP